MNLSRADLAKLRAGDEAMAEMHLDLYHPYEGDSLKVAGIRIYSRHDDNREILGGEIIISPDGYAAGNKDASWAGLGAYVMFNTSCIVRIGVAPLTNAAPLAPVAQRFANKATNTQKVSADLS